MHSYQNNIARTFGEEVLKHILGETWMKAILKYNGVMWSRSHVFDLYLQEQPGTMLTHEIWPDIHGNHKYYSLYA